MACISYLYIIYRHDGIVILTRRTICIALEYSRALLVYCHNMHVFSTLFQMYEFFSWYMLVMVSKIDCLV